MSSLLRSIFFYTVVLLSNIIQCITGFAGTVLAMPFGLMLVGYDTTKPVLNVLGILASVGVIVFNHKKINWKEFIKITLFMIPGIIAGSLLIQYLDISKRLMDLLLAGVILVFTGVGIYTNFIKKNKDENPDSFLKVFIYILLVFAGIVHGMFVCGGPLLIIYASFKLKDRDEFRATLSMSWIVLNTLILAEDIRHGYFSGEAFTPMMVTLEISAVCLIAAILIGDWIATKLNRNVFMILTYVLMGISALSLVLNAVGVIR